MLLKFKANIKAYTVFINTPFYLAVINLNVIKTFIKTGAEINAINL